MEVIDRVRRTIERYDLATPDTRVVVALSGGSDSVALAHLLERLDGAGELHLTAIAHFNHQLRPAADHDEHFCRHIAESLRRPFLADREDVADRARRERRSMEDAARTARHAFLERARVQLGADVVAVGHTRDDQAETFLLRLLRGAGTRGLASMHPRRAAIIRPLLDCRRIDLRAFLEAEQIAYVDDETNTDLQIPRNRVRAEILPLLERFNPAIVHALAREAEIAREAWHWMDAEAARLSRQICRQEGVDSWRLDADALNRAPLALARLVVRQAMTAAAGGRQVSFDHVESVLQLSRTKTGRIDAPGQRVERQGSGLVLRSRPADLVGRWTPAMVPETQAGSPNLFQYPLSIPGVVALREAGVIVSAEEADSVQEAGRAIVGNDPAVVIRRDLCGEILGVRNRRPGDRFRPVGLNGLKKLQDFFVDRKVARHRRDSVPLVVDKRDRIVWVAGYAIDEEFRVTSPVEAVVILRLKVLGGPA